MDVIRMIKVFGWEDKMKDNIREKRDTELDAILKWNLLSQASAVTKYVPICVFFWCAENPCISYTIPLLTMIVTFAVYVSRERVFLRKRARPLTSYRRSL